ncbi:MAG: 4Fe-4S dicluster domain-containing protein, partial [Planctomycetota bacterium]
AFARTKAYSHTGASIRLAKAEALGLDFPVTCIACLRCIDACPQDALTRTPEETIARDADKCDECGACAEACPVGLLDPEGPGVFCTGCNRCLKVCNLKALFAMAESQAPPAPPWEEQESLDGILASERAFNRREGVTEKDDTLPERFRKEPLAEGPSAGSVVELDRMLEDYKKLGSDP